MKKKLKLSELKYIVRRALAEFSGVAALGGGPAVPLGGGPHYPAQTVSAPFVPTKKKSKRKKKK